MSRKKLKFLIGFLVILLALGYLLYTGMSSTMAYYYTPSEIKAKGASIYGEKIRASGELIKESVIWDQITLKLEFKMKDKKDSITVRYQGVVPDTFWGQGKVEAIVEGTYTSEGIFEAKKLMAKCPSRYKAKEKEKK